MATLTLDLSQGNTFEVTLTQSVTSVVLNNPTAGQQFEIIFVQNDAGAYTVAGWPVSVVWGGGLSPTLSVGAGARDVVFMSYDGTNFTGLSSTAASVAGLAIVTPLTSGRYYQGAVNIATSNTLGNGTLRLTPVYIPKAITVASMFAEFTAAGDAASLLALCIYNDDGTGFPGTLAVTGPTISTGSGNAGSVATGGTPGVYEGASVQALAAGLYWIGGVVQGVSVTQPTLRTAQFSLRAFGRSALPSANESALAWQKTGVTGALGTFVGTGQSATSSVPRVGFKVT